MLRVRPQRDRRLLDGMAGRQAYGPAISVESRPEQPPKQAGEVRSADLPETMRAAVFRGHEQIRLEEVPVLLCGPNDAIVKDSKDRTNE